MKKINIIKSKLYDLYWNKKLSIMQIAKQINCSGAFIYIRMIEYKILRRTDSEAVKLVTQGKNNPMFGRNHTKKTIRKMRESKLGFKNPMFGKIGYWANKKRLEIMGENNPNYIDGKGREPYMLGFNDELKEQIRKHDNYTCQLCRKTQKEEIEETRRKLSVHHIDYNKENLDKNNLISLCAKCNTEVNYNRDYWYAYFKYITMEVI